MKNIYKYGFWLLILVAFSLFNLYRIRVADLEKSSEAVKEMYKKRINSLFITNNILDREVKEVTDINSKKLLLEKDSTYLVILLSDFDCAKCQERELIKLDSLQSQLEIYNIKIMAITTQKKLNKSLIFKKQFDLKIPITVVQDNVFKNELSFDTTKYPQLIFVKNGKMTLGFQPITKDFEFSEIFYSNFLDEVKNQN